MVKVPVREPKDPDGGSRRTAGSKKVMRITLYTNTRVNNDVLEQRVRGALSGLHVTEDIDVTEISAVEVIDSDVVR